MAFEAVERMVHYLEPMIIMAISGIREFPYNMPYILHMLLTFNWRDLLLTSGICGPLVLFVTLADILFVQRNPRLLFKPKELQDLWFARFWLFLGPIISYNERDHSPVPELVHSSTGVVLELGPGSGEQLYCYDIEKITHIYGVEPCLALIPALKAKIKELGLQDKYTIVPHVVEDLGKLMEYGVEEGGVDTVLSIRVLCSVRNVEETVRGVYRMLKPGGKIVFFEHIRSRYLFPRLLEEVYNIPWSYMIANCHLNRPTDKILVRGLEWAEVDMIEPVGQKSFAVVPYVYGTLVKAGKA
ncbi:hypothetical protein GP486_002288 [Trichoglossum hirsutum]|uniref:Methyltransferase type 11 domain-containing protein n=1 Tax=Trichoglossum hirsutum TaxID=265104 RepID=A0A9P8LF82_9PEZI|nr:hypothetical protein GP486_002288 [Trichoglossum hirsutum]